MVRVEVQRAERLVEGRLAELYALHAPEARRLAYLLTGSAAHADDLVQDAFVRLAGRFLDLRDRQGFGHYLRRTIVNLHHSWWRRKKVERAYIEREAQRPAQAVAPHDPAEREALWQAGVPVSLAVDRGSVFVSIHNASGVPDELVRIGEGSARVEARAAHDTAGNIVARGGIVILASPTESGLTVTGLDPISLERALPYYQAPKPYFESDIDILDEEVLIADFVFDREFLDVLYHGPATTTGRLQSIRLEEPVRFVAAGDGVAWVAGNVNGYTVLSRVRL